jgi:D-alanyl-D-alanine carboxypeptidase
VRLRHWDFGGRSRVGVIVVDAAETGRVVSVFRRLYAARFPVRRMLGVEVYRGSDDRSMRADNTSAFNCRFVGGTSRWSEHAYGRAIDLNPVENPYVHGGVVEPPAGRAYLDRSHGRAGMATHSSVVVRAFDSVGWHWGGRWRSSKDYQHFSTNGR